MQQVLSQSPQAKALHKLAVVYIFNRDHLHKVLVDLLISRQVPAYLLRVVVFRFNLVCLLLALLDQLNYSLEHQVLMVVPFRLQLVTA